MTSKESHKPFTFQTRINLDESDEILLDACAKLLSTVERRLFADLAAKKDIKTLKSSYIKIYGITARQFNAIRVVLEGKIASIKEKQKSSIESIQDKIQYLNKWLLKKEKSYKFNVLHQKKRLLFNLQMKLKHLLEAQSNGTVSLCFGSSKLFRAQFNLEKNGFHNKEEWFKEWRFARNNSFFLIGSKDEASGNQSCTATVNPDGSLALRIRLPDGLATNHSKYLMLPNVHFKYGQDHILEALKSCETRKELKAIKSPLASSAGLPICYRFKKDHKGWRLFITVPVAQGVKKASSNNGVIGVDINVDHIAIAETDRFGNPIAKKSIALCTYGKSQNQSKALIGDVCKELVLYAKKASKPLVIESLDFRKKKTELKDKSPKYARMLSSFSYNAIKNNLASKTWMEGVELKEVNPAYTSIIGRCKFAKRYGLTTHQAAALTIGRRNLNLSERVPRQMGAIPDGKGDHVALSVPVRNRGKHVWSYWRALNVKLRTVLAAHFRSKNNRSLNSKYSS